MESQLIGQCLGSYRLVRAIARGGMGEVFEAEHVLLGRRAAVKVLLPELSQQSDAVGRFFQEARTAAAVQHPGMVAVFDFGYLEEGNAYIVMELLEGQTLEELIDDRGRLDPHDAVHICRQIALAMAAAHARGVIHRDLKPENVSLVPDSETPGGLRVKILDFGVAKLARDENPGTTRTGELLGTPLYMAPEQCRGGRDVDWRADIYALGCILYDLATGAPPFDLTGVGEVLAAHLREPPVPPSSRVPGISAAFDALVLRMLAKRREDRPQSMMEIHGLLGEVLEAAPAAGPVTAAAQRAFSSPTRKVALSVAGLVVGLLVALVAVPPPTPLAVPARIAVPARVVPPPVAATAVPRAPTVRLRVESRPAGAEVFRVDRPGRTIVGRTPVVLEVPADEGRIALRLRKRGHAAEIVEVETLEDATVKVVLTPSDSSPQASVHDGALDPFRP